MLGPRIVLERRLLVAYSAMLLSLASCGGKEFSQGGGGKSGAGGSDSAGSAAGGSMGAMGGSAASAGDGGNGAGGSGGSGGTVATACNCKAGQYCREGSTDCFECNELSRLRFATPERLSTLSDNTQDARFPRMGRTNTDLLYFFQGVGIRYTTDASTSAGGAVEKTLPVDNGPLLLPAAATVPFDALTGGGNFVFDRVVEETRRQLYVGRWSDGLEGARALGSPFNGPTNDFSVAIAPEPQGDTGPRVFWMTDRDAMLGLTLVTTLVADTSAPLPVQLQLGNTACTLASPLVDPRDDLTPWVTPDGKTLLVSHTAVDASCRSAGRGKDLYTAPLQPATGQPTLPAALIGDVNSPQDDVDPSFSADMCDLYFASNRDGGAFALYRARRR
jgi:hypothetical protein